jgi:4-diphosphocytidyl-2-C-methyl-D-erythritol kinase
MLSSFAPAKVNLFLHVTGKRADGYHLLDSLAVFPAVGDRLTFEPDATLSLTLSLTLTGRFGASLSAEPDNLVLRAARHLAAQTAIKPAGRLVLEKNLPVASGIGGGSADAAAALRLLARQWNSTAKLPDIALSLGADVPVCLARRAARMQGIGEMLSSAPKLPVFGMLLVNPAPATLPRVWPDAAAMAADLVQLGNDLQAPAIRLAPGIAQVLAVLQALPGVLLARMSGSGATCFAIFATPSAAAGAAASLNQPDWWCWGGGLYEPGPDDL